VTPAAPRVTVPGWGWKLLGFQGLSVLEGRTGGRTGRKNLLAALESGLCGLCPSPGGGDLAGRPPGMLELEDYCRNPLHAPMWERGFFHKQNDNPSQGVS
jgi:hypothetical protein